MQIEVSMNSRFVMQVLSDGDRGQNKRAIIEQATRRKAGKGLSLRHLLHVLFSHHMCALRT